ncbi:MAG: hypothetical protein Q8942_13325 [Bacillota bacterium]|nr:hypothetical protein [Bacillota bacterium]
MNNFNIKSIVLGIGIGIILTSLISVIYVAGNNGKSAMTDEEVIKRASSLGMIKADDSPEIQTVLPGYDVKNSVNNDVYRDKSNNN